MNNMMKSPDSAYPDEVYESVISQIADTYGDVTIEELRSTSKGILPQEISIKLDLAISKYNLEHQIYPVYQTTKSEDGVTCANCHEKLIVTEIITSSSLGVFKKKVLKCPFKGLNCKADADRIKFEKRFAETKEVMKSEKEVYVLRTRGMTQTEARKIYTRNLNDENFTVSAPNIQFTELHFGMKTLFEQDIIKGESKKIQTKNICSHDLEHMVSLENGKLLVIDGVDENDKQTYKLAKNFNLVSVKAIGKLGLVDTYYCNQCRWISETLGKKGCEQYYADSEYEAKQFKENIEKAEEGYENTVTYQVQWQRIDSEVEKEIIKAMREVRLDNNSNFFKSAEIYDKVTGKEFVLIVGHSQVDKSFVASRMKKLARKGILELEVESWEFTIMGESYGNYLDSAKTLNHYRWFDKDAVFLVGSLRKELDDVKKEYDHYPSQEEKIILRERKHKVFDCVAKQLGLESTSGVMIGNYDRQIYLYCKIKDRPEQ